ncbi:RNA polymerase subunit sigma-70 [Synechococcus sp. CS-1326]|uniref:sigma-70 family RNA polymerase sigma factor n=1 Tax=Synechococcus sp. CS-1326 TaxID=2847978 RepID=UPI00223C3822|nr:sigma factor [Synechococcus sp. CS-1326]MCT0213098.1 RNA polymerase subunit sigma-70 [Synechococcus sp. CS-1326]
MAQLLLPLLASATDVVVPSPRPLRRRRRLPCVHLQLVFAFPYQPPPQTPRKPRRQRPEHPQAAVHRLALAHVDLADKIAGNFARRTTHPFDDLRQLAVIGLLKAAARFDGRGGRSFRAYARTYANGEITHYLRDHGFAIKVPPSWRDLYASGQKLLCQGTPPAELPERLRVTSERWAEISVACSVRLVGLPQET